jgi:elongation factor P
MATVNAGNLTKGMYITFKGAPHAVIKTEFMSPGKGTPVMRARLRNVQTGSVQEYTYKSAESVDLVEVVKKELQFLYRDGDEIVFMNPKTYEQESLPMALMEDKVKFLVQDLKCYVLFYQSKAIGIDLPPNIVLKVVEAEDSVAGNRVNAPKKPVKLETGLIIDAPIFVKVGDKISVDTSNGTYISRVK